METEDRLPDGFGSRTKRERMACRAKNGCVLAMAQIESHGRESWPGASWSPARETFCWRGGRTPLGPREQMPRGEQGQPAKDQVHPPCPRVLLTFNQ